MRRRLLATVALVAVLFVADMQQAAPDQFATRAAIGLIHVYQATLSRWYATLGVQCRFTPTCSHYGEACLRQFGAVRGGWLAMKRVVRCGPWTPMGTLDPPPVAGVVVAGHRAQVLT
jgi:putative membrane protein insertion efficiency factor